MAMKKTILIVEDDKEIMRMISTYLKGNGYEVLEASDGMMGVEQFQAHQEAIDLVLLDVMLPKMNGLAVLEHIRTASKLPVIMVTAMDQDYDQIIGLKKGADDYISKPFSPSVLLARIEAIVRRQPKKESGLKLGHLFFDADNVTVTDHDEVLSLSEEEYQLLSIFAQHPEKLISDEQIAAMMGCEKTVRFEQDIETIVMALREKITDGQRLIRPVHGAGYVFQPERRK